MTGFGRGSAEVNGISANVELRSVNKRFFETSLRLPGTLAAREADVEALLKAAFERGRISAQVQVDSAEDAALPIEVDPETARAYRRLLDELRATADLDDPVRLEHLLKFSDVFTTVEESEEADDESWPAVREALGIAIDDLQDMRAREGVALKKDLTSQVDAIEKELDTAKARIPLRLEEVRQKLRERLRELVEDDQIDNDRIETEMAILADKLDVSEECVRLASHIELFREALENDDAVGRKLNFIVQEMHREVNTIGSKANDTELAHGAVRMKEAIEKIREQVRNVE